MKNEYKDKIDKAGQQADQCGDHTTAEACAKLADMCEFVEGKCQEKSNMVPTQPPNPNDPNDPTFCFGKFVLQSIAHYVLGSLHIVCWEFDLQIIAHCVLGRLTCK